MRVLASVGLAAMIVLLAGWTLSDNAVAPKQSPWNPRGKAVLKTPDGVSLVIRSAFCSFGRHGLVRLRFGGKFSKADTTDKPHMQLVATRREGDPAVLDLFDGILDLPPGWPDASAGAGTAHIVQSSVVRRGTFVLYEDRGYDPPTDKPRYTGIWNCG